jgi:hypothetical protein
MSDLFIPFMDRIALVHAIAKVSIELIAIYFHFFEIFVIQIGEMSIYHPESICTSAQTSISRTSASKSPATA